MKMAEIKRLKFIRATRLADIIERPNNLRTKIWRVRNVQSRVTLGLIRWRGAWRQYAFEPDSNLVFEKTCLRTIADFCDRNTRRHYAQLRKRKADLG
jgi:hypothetical protein